MMKRIIFSMLVLLTIVSCKHEVKTSVLQCQPDNKAADTLSLIGKKLTYDYGKDVYEVQFITADSLHWICVKGDEQGKEADESYSTQRLSSGSLFISWIEADGLGVSQVVDLKEKTIHSFLKMDKQIIPLSGIISE